jgi:hypothetical protein
VVDVLAQGSGALLHAQTFSHHPVACAAGLAAIAYIENHQLVARCAVMGSVLHQRLERLRELPAVGDIRGRGLLAGIELVADRAQRTPFPRAQRMAERIAARAMEEGLIVWPNTGHVNGVDGDLIMLSPPYVIEEREIDLIVDRLLTVLKTVD